VKSSPTFSALHDVTRPVMIVAALYARRPSLMSRPEWSAVTKRNPNDDEQTHSDSGLGYLIDALAHISVLYYAGDKVVNSHTTTCFTGSNNHAGPFQTLLVCSLSVREDTGTQRKQWKVAHPDPEILPVSHNNCHSSPRYPFSVVTHFSPLEAANASTFYNAVLVMIN
jgi:hypothetical protein